MLVLLNRPVCSRTAEVKLCSGAIIHQCYCSLAAGEQLLSQPESCPDINPAVKLQDTPNHADCGQDLSHSRGSPLVKPLCERLQQLTAADAGWFRVDNRTRPQPERFTK